MYGSQFISVTSTIYFFLPRYLHLVKISLIFISDSICHRNISGNHWRFFNSQGSATICDSLHMRIASRGSKVAFPNCSFVSMLVWRRSSMFGQPGLRFRFVAINVIKFLRTKMAHLLLELPDSSTGRWTCSIVSKAAGRLYLAVPTFQENQNLQSKANAAAQGNMASLGRNQSRWAFTAECTESPPHPGWLLLRLHIDEGAKSFYHCSAEVIVPCKNRFSFTM